MNYIKEICDTVRQLILVLVLQGVVFVLLALLILLYPAFLIALSAAMFLVLGVSLLVIAAKIHAFWRKVPDFLKR